ncbi:MAG: hypothetical protein Q4A84_06365 [Neisseria sp.]|uniref:hypothetical protein n=1 Tax=Neisseria sp. TaxID=192066 RepID=UPI0026DDB96F|nr:hypothetical protein [Neisseria sp.]MDO4641309.1 hypothetical protein [Neisseria sp.]
MQRNHHATHNPYRITQPSSRNNAAVNSPFYLVKRVFLRPRRPARANPFPAL